MKSSQPHRSLNMLTNTGGKKRIYIYLYKKNPHWSTVAMATPARAERLHKAMGVTVMWSSYTESVCVPQCWEPRQEVGSGKWDVEEVAAGPPGAAFWSRDQNWPADGRLAGQTPNPAQNRRSHPQSANHFSLLLLASLIWPCFALVTVRPICCLLALISQTASATAAATDVRFISCSICGCVISPLEKKKKSHCLSWSFPRTNLVVVAIKLEPKIQQTTKLSGLSL